MNEKTSILIVEDEALIADHIAASLQEFGMEIAGIADNSEDAMHALRTIQPSIVLIDINLKEGLDGIDLAHHINRHYEIPFIFLTGNSDSKTIERVKLTQPYGFVLKPYTGQDLKTTIELALYKWQTDRPKTSTDSSFFIKDKHKLQRINFEDIGYVEALDNYCIVYTKTSKHILPHTLKSIEEKLSALNFFRTHRSFLVNVDKIESVLPRAVLVYGKEIPLSENLRSQLTSRLRLL